MLSLPHFSHHPTDSVPARAQLAILAGFAPPAVTVRARADGATDGEKPWVYERLMLWKHVYPLVMTNYSY